MRKIIIILPDKHNKVFRLQRKGGIGKKFLTGVKLFSSIKITFSRSNLKEKTAIVVKMGRDTLNESIPSSDPSYLLYCVGCFLENYLSNRFLARIEKTYGENLTYL